MAKSVKLPGGRYYSIKQAADALGLTVARVCQLIESHDLVCVTFSDRVRLIPEAEVRRLKTPSTVGRPRSGAK